MPADKPADKLPLLYLNTSAEHDKLGCFAPHCHDLPSPGHFRILPDPSALAPLGWE